MISVQSVASFPTNLADQSQVEKNLIFTSPGLYYGFFESLAAEGKIGFHDCFI